MKRHGHGKPSASLCDQAMDHDRGADETHLADYVVAGVGTAGAALVRRLSDAGFSVHAIEAGEDTRRDPAVLNRDAFVNDALNRDPKFHWFTPADLDPLTRPPARTDAQLDFYPEGRMWGGSSGHNYLQAIRGTPALYAEWAQVNPALSYDALLPLFKALETYTPTITGVFNAAQRGNQGPLALTQQGFLNPASAVDPANGLVLALGSAGFSPYSADYNDPTRGTIVTGDFQQYIVASTQERSWSASAFLGPDVVGVDDDGNGFGRCNRDLFIASNSVAIRVLFDDEPHVLESLHGIGGLRGGNCAHHAARGLRYVQGDRIIDVLARRKVILATGSVHDPVLLQRSGIGPESVLAELGIPIRLANENVGRKGQVHYGPQVITAADPDAPGSIKSFFDLQGPNVGPGTGRREWQTDAISNLAIAGSTVWLTFLLRPARNSSVTLRTPAFPSDPLLRVPAVEDPSDIEKIVGILKVIANVSLAYTSTFGPARLPTAPTPAAYPAAEYGAFGGMAPDDQALIDYARAQTFVRPHLSGTTRMSRDPDSGVVDPNLDVWGIENLAIASNAVAPTILDGNPSWSAYVLGLFKAQLEASSNCTSNARRGHRHRA